MRSLRRKVKNLRNELAIQADAYAKYRRLYWSQLGGYRRGKAESDAKVRRIEDTLTLMAQQQAWYRERFDHIASLVRSDDWRRRAMERPGAHFDAIAWLAEDANRQPMFPSPSSQDGAA